MTAEAQRVTTNRILSARGQRLRAHPVVPHTLGWLHSLPSVTRRASEAVVVCRAQHAVSSARRRRVAVAVPCSEKLSPDGARSTVDDGERRCAGDARAAAEVFVPRTHTADG